jgi:hypothetical protein
MGLPTKKASEGAPIGAYLPPPDPFDSVPLQSPHDPAQSRANPEVGTKEFASIVRTDPFTLGSRPRFNSVSSKQS